MRLAITLLGLDLLTVDISTEADNGIDPGDCTTYPVGFVPTDGDQRWEQGAEL